MLGKAEKKSFHHVHLFRPGWKKNVNIKAERKLSLPIVYSFPALIKTASKTGWPITEGIMITEGIKFCVHTKWMIPQNVPII